MRLRHPVQGEQVLKSELATERTGEDPYDALSL